MSDPAKAACFVIMPFGDKVDVDGKTIHFDEVYEYIIKPAVEQAGLSCIRCDEARKSGWVHDSMLRFIRDADLAVVDITTENPNVFYELGIRHALKKRVTVLIRKAGTKIPFNLSGLHVVNYDVGLKSSKQAIEEIATVIANSMPGDNSDSRVYDVFPDLTMRDLE